MTHGVRRYRVWRRSLVLVAGVLRLTGRVTHVGTLPLAARLRRTVLQVPVLVTRAVGRARRDTCCADLESALGVLQVLEWHLRLSAPLFDSEPGEIRQLGRSLLASRGAIEALRARVSMDGRSAQPSREPRRARRESDPGPIPQRRTSGPLGV